MKKHESNDLWKGNNESGFSALPSGTVNDYYKFENLNSESNWWSSSPAEWSSTMALYCSISTNWDDFKITKGALKDRGMSVRCVSDTPAELNNSSTSISSSNKTTSNQEITNSPAQRMRDVPTSSVNSNLESPCSVKSKKNNEIEYCLLCNGTGQETKKSSSICPNCVDWNSEYRSKVACHVCKDTRKNPNIKTWKETCRVCNGSGRNYEQEKRNKEFGGYDTKLVNGLYNGIYNNYEFKSVSIEHRYKGLFVGGVQTEFTFSEWPVACGCLGSEWSLPSKDELVLITKYLQSQGIKGDGQYATNEQTGSGDYFDAKEVWVVGFGQSIIPERKRIGSAPDSNWQLKSKVICIKRK